MAVLSTKLAFVTMVTMALLVMTNGFVVKIDNEQVFNVEKEFDYFTLALSWAETYCGMSHKCCEENACCKKDYPKGFVIRGLWPDYSNGSYPTCCNDLVPFEESEVKSLRPVLNKYMPSLECPKTACNEKKRSNLAYQWEKHGTCTFPVIQSEYSYFLQTLHLFFKHNVTALLKEAGYGTSSSTETHALEGISSTIEKAYGAKPHFTCTKFDAIKDVRLCFRKNFEPRDCAQASTSTSASSCPKNVHLPIFGEPDAAKRVWTANPLIEELGAL